MAILKHERIQFSQDMTGNHLIEQGSNKISINLAHAEEEEIRDVLNGIANMLSSLSAHLYDRIRSDAESRQRMLDGIKKATSKEAK